MCIRDRIRKDWLDKLGLEVPKTMDDVMEVARAFVEMCIRDRFLCGAAPDED